MNNPQRNLGNYYGPLLFSRHIFLGGFSVLPSPNRSKKKSKTNCRLFSMHDSEVLEQKELK